ncbi:MAG: gluconate 2-dehydrogenase subunit 3 family protein, partial [Saprospiraceae bacterium]|nr:gluconate 2-dehydrogenase subunit 3 family protein [Saprospiraceae bacterium]
MNNRSNISRREALKRTSLVFGGTLAASTVAGIMSGCQAPLDPDWTPSFFTTEQSETIAMIAEAIIPKTETPGALDAKVHRYIDELANNVFSEKRQEELLDGLSGFDAHCKELYFRTFAKLRDDQRAEYLMKLHEESQAKERSRGDSPSFFSSMRQLTIAGFCTSEIGATQVLKHDPIPGSYE